MRRLAILTFVSLDGVMQAPGDRDEDRSGGFAHGGWAQPWWPEVMEQVRVHAMAEPYDLLLGHATYDIFAPHWSAQSGSPEADKFNAATKYVAVGKRDGALSWQNTVPLRGDVVREIAKLKKEDGPLLQVHGSAALIQTLLANDLIDELRLWTFPLVLGSGKRLFQEPTATRKFVLVKSAATENGVIMGIYRRV